MLARLLLIFGFVIGAVHYLGVVKSWYWAYRWFDTPMHLAGGAWVALLFFYLFEERFRAFDAKKNFLFTVIIVLGFVAFISILWEFYEYFHDTFITRVPPNTPRPHPNLYADTLKDFLNDLIGGTSAILVWWFYIKKLSSPVNKNSFSFKQRKPPKNQSDL